MRIVCSLVLMVTLLFNLSASPVKSRAKSSYLSPAPKSNNSTNKQAATNDKNKKTIKISPALLKKLHYQRKDPFLAGFLSVPMWGLGHFYTREYTKGSLFVFGDLIYKALLIGLVLKLNNKYTSDSLGDNSVTWGELSASDKTLVIGYLVTYVGITIWAVADATASAERFNKRYDLRQYFDLNLRKRDGSTDLLLGMNFRF